LPDTILAVAVWFRARFIHIHMARMSVTYSCAGTELILGYYIKKE
jgi:hypothetical protein